MDLGRLLREQIREAVETATRSSATSVNVASAVNLDADGHVTVVRSEDAVTIIQRDDQTRVIRHDEENSGRHGE